MNQTRGEGIYPAVVDVATGARSEFIRRVYIYTHGGELLRWREKEGGEIVTRRDFHAVGVTAFCWENWREDKKKTRSFDALVIEYILLVKMFNVAIIDFVNFYLFNGYIIGNVCVWRKEAVNEVV